MVKYEDFFGEYVGWCDGKPCQLTISDTKADSAHPIFAISLGSRGGTTEFRGSHVQRRVPNGREHILTDVTLKPVNEGNEDKFFSRLHLHTWDTRYLSGVTIWHGIEFGALFERS